MEATDVVIRPPGPRDAAALAAVQVASWRAAYRGIIPRDFLDGLDADRIAAVWDRRIAESAGGTASLLAAAGGKAVGFAFLGPPLEDAAAGTGQLYALYVHPQWWGRGVGSALFAAAERSLAGLGYARALLWVEERNDRAIRFYTARGWPPDGARMEDGSLGTPLRLQRHGRALPGAPRPAPPGGPDPG